MPWRRKLWLGFWTLILLFCAGIFLLEACVGKIGSGVAVGSRRIRDEYHLICGIQLNNGQVRYYRYVIPTEFGLPDRCVESHTSRWQFLGLGYIPYFANPIDWYYAVGIPFWFIGAMSSV